MLRIHSQFSVYTTLYRTKPFMDMLLRYRDGFARNFPVKRSEFTNAEQTSDKTRLGRLGSVGVLGWN